MRVGRGRGHVVGRGYFGVQALAGALWWVSVALVPWVRGATLGPLDSAIVAWADIPLFVVGSVLAAAGVRVAAVIATAWTMLVAAGMVVVATVSGEGGWGVLLMAGAAGCSVLALALVMLGRIPTRWILVGPFAFRPARASASRIPALLATLSQMIVFWTIFLGVLPVIIAVLERRWRLGVELPPDALAAVSVIGAVQLVLASALGVWSAITMAWQGRGTPLPAATAPLLVIRGPYRIVRNPMAVAGIAQGVVVGLVLSSWLVVAYALIGSVVWNYAVRPHEEADLESRFGDTFARYRARVGCWVPRPRRESDRAAAASPAQE